MLHRNYSRSSVFCFNWYLPAYSCWLALSKLSGPLDTPCHLPSIPTVGLHVALNSTRLVACFEAVHLHPTYRPSPCCIGPGWAWPRAWWCAPSHLPSIPRCPSPYHNGPGWAWPRIWWYAPSHLPSTPPPPSVTISHWAWMGVSPGLMLDLDGRVPRFDDVRLPTYRPSPAVRHHVTLDLDGRGSGFDGVHPDLRLNTKLLSIQTIL